MNFENLLFEFLLKQGNFLGPAPTFTLPNFVNPTSASHETASLVALWQALLRGASSY